MPLGWQYKTPAPGVSAGQDDESAQGGAAASQERRRRRSVHWWDRVLREMEGDVFDFEADLAAEEDG